jgi:hypothetical protein
MQKLPAVEEAKTLFEEAKDWGVWRWLTEKPRARRTADAAWAALDDCEKKLKAGWSKELRKLAAKQFKAAEEAATKAHMDAEAQFDYADRHLSAAMAREGAQMAIDAWILREKFIRKLEAFARQSKGPGEALVVDHVDKPSAN